MTTTKEKAIIILLIWALSLLADRTILKTGCFIALHTLQAKGNNSLLSYSISSYARSISILRPKADV